MREMTSHRHGYNFHSQKDLNSDSDSAPSVVQGYGPASDLSEHEKSALQGWGQVRGEYGENTWLGGRHIIDMRLITVTVTSMTLEKEPRGYIRGKLIHPSGDRLL